MLKDEEIMAIRNKCSHENGVIISMDFAREIERAVLAKALAQQERLHKEWSELWNPIDEIVRPITPFGESVADKAVELISIGLAKAGEREPIAHAVYQGCLSGVRVSMLANAPKDFSGYLYSAPIPVLASTAVDSTKSDDGLLPIHAADHPDCRVMYWSEQELLAIKDYARRCIAAQAIPEGWQLVPINVSGEMLGAAKNVPIRYGYDEMDNPLYTVLSPSELNKLWAALLSAPPKP